MVQKYFVAQTVSIAYTSDMRRKKLCRAMVALAQHLDTTSTTQSQLASALGVRPSLVSQWLAGLGRPSHRLMAMLEAIAGIPARDWLTASEAADVSRVTNNALCSQQEAR